MCFLSHDLSHDSVSVVAQALILGIPMWCVVVAWRAGCLLCVAVVVPVVVPVIVLVAVIVILIVFIVFIVFIVVLVVLLSGLSWLLGYGCGGVGSIVGVDR